MNNLLIRYVFATVFLVGIFSQFVACGSQFYGMKVDDEPEASRLPGSNPAQADPTSTTYGIHNLKGWESLPIPFYFGDRFNDDQQKALLKAMETWEKAVGRKLFQLVGKHTGVSGDSFSDLFSSLRDAYNGHYLDADWSKTKKPSEVIATAIWDLLPQSSAIVTSDIRFNEQHYLIGDSMTLDRIDEREVVDMQTLALHELGHLLGLSHVASEVDPLSIMNPTLFIGQGLSYRHLSKGDIQRIQTIYGCQGNACDVARLVEEINRGSKAH